jgi:peptidoglycan/LPS O-acetylase OafA/YrhL
MLQNHMPTRLYLLDILRGFASLVVVVWHYQHFFFIAPDTFKPGFTRDMQPLYAMLSLFYEHGYRAVYLFFALSGFVFYFQYGEAIRAESVTLSKFFKYRFSRLYPLHFVTLLLVALGQAASRSIDGQELVYPCNDWQHFGLHLVFVTDWSPTGAPCSSFNFPVWSVSIEIFLYAVFFLVALNLPRRWSGQVLLTAVLVLFGVGMAQIGGPPVMGEPLYCFFSGGLAYLFWSRFCQPRHDTRKVIAVSAFMLIASATLCWLNGANSYILGVVTYPSAIVLLASSQSLRHDLGYRLRLIGDITYATYLLHFPIQLGLLLLVKAKLLAIDFTSPVVFIAFIALVIGLSIPTYYRFERPMQQALRHRSMMPKLANSG